MHLRLGSREFDLTTRALVMGILNRTPDSFFDQGSYFGFDDFLRRADKLVAEGADVLDIGGVTAGPGSPVSVDEERERVVPAIEALASRFDCPLSVDTWRASVAEVAFGAGACVGNDISGFADPAYLSVAATAEAAVVATHIRMEPRVADPAPHYGDVVVEVVDYLIERAHRAEAAGVAADRIIVDAGLDLGKTPEQSLALLRASDRLSVLGYPLLLSASNKEFLGSTLDLAVEDRRSASLAAAILGVTRGCRIIRTHDVAGTRRVRDTVAAILEAP